MEDRQPKVGEMVQINITQLPNTPDNPEWRPLLVSYVENRERAGRIDQVLGGHLFLLPRDIAGYCDETLDNMQWCNAVQLRKLGDCSAFACATGQGALQSHWRFIPS